MTAKRVFTAVACAIALAAACARPAAAVEFWSVDIQGAGSGDFGQSAVPFTMAGADPTFGLGSAWNAYNVPAHALPAAIVPPIAMADRDGVPSTVTFGINEPIGGWGGAGPTGGANDLLRDYLFVQAGNSPATATFTISGLVPGASYDMINFGGVARDAAITVDFNGDGNLTEASRLAPIGGGAAFRGIVASPAGKIIGRVADGTVVPEGNWAGFHLMRATSGKVWSVDIQGAGSNLFGQDVVPADMSGVENIYGFGNVWNHVNVPGYDLDPAPVTAPLVDSDGAASAVTFNIVDPVQGWGGDPSMGTDPLRRDYLFAQAGRSPNSAEWTITGLTPGHTYEMFAYSGAARGVNLLVDQTNEQLTFGGYHLFGNIAVGPNGTISGLVSGIGGEANWSGFQLRDVTAVPEPSSAVLALCGVGAAGLIRRRRK
jgi:MYXO-CTERM domain-containing protein